jgi:ribosome-binding factor A
MESTRQQKVSRLLQKELADIFQKKSSSLSPGLLLTVTLVRVSPDLSFAKVYISIFSVKNKEEIFEKIKENVKELRGELGKRVKNQLRIVPELAFYIDDSLDYADKIDKLLKR